MANTFDFANYATSECAARVNTALVVLNRGPITEAERLQQGHLFHWDFQARMAEHECVQAFNDYHGQPVWTL